MPGHLLNSATKTMLEGFVNPEDTAQKKNSYVELAALIITFVLSLLIISLIGKLLWNGVIVDLFTCVRPVKDVWHILGLFVFLSLLF